MAVRRRDTAKSKAFLILAGAVFVLFAALPTAILLTVGLMPTLAALIVDVTRKRYLTKCVAGMNFAGVVPYLQKLLTEGHDLQAALSIVSDAIAWLVMYSAAGMGWLLFLGLPGIVSMARVLNAKRRIYVLQERQKELLNEWGECILPNSDAAQDADSVEAAQQPSSRRAAAQTSPAAS